MSPVELDPVRRVLADGPDDRRGNPKAEGLVSLDLRAGRLPPGLEKKYPAIGAVLAGVERVRGSAAMGDEGVKIEADVLGATVAGAERAARFLEAYRDILAADSAVCGGGEERAGGAGGEDGAGAADGAGQGGAGDDGGRRAGGPRAPATPGETLNGSPGSPDLRRAPSPPRRIAARSGRSLR